MNELPNQLEAGMERHASKPIRITVSQEPGSNPVYQNNPNNDWCATHRRKATHVLNGKPCCDPQLGGILLPCDTFSLEVIPK